MMCSAKVVLPDDSGPNTSITRPRGKPPAPSAASSEIDPVGITLTGWALREPSCRTAPFPNCFSIWRSVCVIWRARSPDEIGAVTGVLDCMVNLTYRCPGPKKLLKCVALDYGEEII